MSEPHPLTVDLHPALSRHEAKVESDRCYFCHDAPCVTACPTGIDIPLFIRQINTGNPAGAAKTIFNENIFGGMCARVCPTETLCEEACVRNLAEENPVQIGLLQRNATDHQMATGKQPYERADATGNQIAVVGAGPAGIACAHRLALYGHQVNVIEARAKQGGLNEYGIASYKTVDDFAQKEVEYILSIGGITVDSGKALGKDFTLDELLDKYDAVFLGIGLGDVNQLGITNDSATGVSDAVDFISDLRQSANVDSLDTGNRVVVIGGGMTAIDAAVQSRMLGASEVTIAYRRGIEQMSASEFEQQLAQVKGVVIKPWLQPDKVITDDAGNVSAVEFACTTQDGDKLKPTGESVTLLADKVLTAIGQKFDPAPLSGASLDMQGNKIRVNDQRQSSHAKIWAGGDCITGGEDLTVSAVQDGKVAAESIHAALNGVNHGRPDQ